MEMSALPRVDRRHKAYLILTDQDMCNKCREREAEIKQKLADWDCLGAYTLYKRCGYVPKLD